MTTMYFCPSLLYVLVPVLFRCRVGLVPTQNLLSVILSGVGEFMDSESLGR